MSKTLATLKVGKNGFGNNNKKKYLTIHQTGNTAKGANAAMHAKLQLNNSREASWHWSCDDTQAIQSFEHTAQLYHCSDGAGDGNMNSIGVEGCINSDGNYKKSVQNMAELAAWILKTENIPIGNMKQHHDWARDKKNCPAQIRAGKDGINWTRFVTMVQAELDKLNGKTTVVKPVVESSKAYKIVVEVNGYSTAANAKDKKSAKTKVKDGDYSVFKESNGMINVTSKAGKAGSWINPSENIAKVTPKPVSKPASNGIEKKYAEKDTFYPNKSLNVYDKPSTSEKHVATYNPGEEVTYHTVHIGNGYSWIQYTRGGGKGEGYLPIRTYKAGIYGKVDGAFKSEGGKPFVVVKDKKTYVTLSASEPTWRVYALGQQPIASLSTKMLAPARNGGLKYEVLGYEDGGQCAIIKTQDFGRVKIFIKDPSAKITVE